MAPTAAQVLEAVKRSGVRYELTPGWDDPRNAAPGVWAPAYVIQHHTANGGAGGNNPSLAWCVKGSYPPVRNCHFLIGRDGTVFVVYALKCYHAGKGGPGHWGDGPAVQSDSMNGRAFGIEVESKGMSPVPSLVDGFTDAQLDALARLNAALLDLLGAVGEGRIINHRTWAPTRKVDTRYADSFLQSITKAARDRLNAKPRPPLDVDAPMKVSAYTRPTKGPVIRTARRHLGCKDTDTWIPGDDFDTAYSAYLRRHMYLYVAGARSFKLTKRAYESICKN